MLLLARRDWRDKLHLMEKAGLNDVRVFDVSDDDGTNSFLFEIEIAPSGLALSAIQPIRYLFSCPSEKIKTTWLEAYRNITQINIRSKRLSETTNISSSGVDEEDEEEDFSITSTLGSAASLGGSVAGISRFSSRKTLKEKDKEREEERKKLISEKAIDKAKIEQLTTQLSAVEEKLIEVEKKLKEKEKKFSEMEKTFRDSVNDFKVQESKMLEVHRSLEASEKSKKDELNALRRVVSGM
ncbi:hypothetical protein HK096_007526, partial [Nowakowskiella sp. JEL0078]